MCLACPLLNYREPMNPKSENHSKPSPAKPSRKDRKGTTETARLFIDVDEVLRRPLTVTLTRYVE